MGSGASKVDENQAVKKKKSNPDGMIINDCSSNMRLDHCEHVKSVRVDCPTSSFQLNYAYVSQKGYYPTSSSKPNQDSYCLCQSMSGLSNCLFFGVFDGHGDVGDKCSHLVAQQVSAPTHPLNQT